MVKNLQELDDALNGLQQSIKTVLSRCDPEHHSDAFAGLADAIMDDTPPNHHDHVWSRLQCIQRDAGLIPGDDEPYSEEP
ncbi:hypothetical protein [Pseudoxanthomonas mexicana]|uniref:hypothetical protein n=1 Tax=Pseudoxanthomonas mexicana TaxID=128785 RepID=UPI0028AF2F0C|nr:hypothetical protein [Pseudoxanthomonas mexicana]